ALVDQRRLGPCFGSELEPDILLVGPHRAVCHPELDCHRGSRNARQVQHTYLSRRKRIAGLAAPRNWGRLELDDRHYATPTSSAACRFASRRHSEHRISPSNVSVCSGQNVSPHTAHCSCGQHGHNRRVQWSSLHGVVSRSTYGPSSSASTGSRWSVRQFL